MRACLRACMPARLRACAPACLRASVPACLPARMRARARTRVCARACVRGEVPHSCSIVLPPLRHHLDSHSASAHHQRPPDSSVSPATLRSHCLDLCKLCEYARTSAEMYPFVPLVACSKSAAFLGPAGLVVLHGSNQIKLLKYQTAGCAVSSSRFAHAKRCICNADGSHVFCKQRCNCQGFSGCTS